MTFLCQQLESILEDSVRVNILQVSVRNEEYLTHIIIYHKGTRSKNERVAIDVN
jgi:hypothetical protein